eukprot:scaffold6550_cov167-Amphora_coffeaeformis.AAC.8
MLHDYIQERPDLVGQLLEISSIVPLPRIVRHILFKTKDTATLDLWKNGFTLIRKGSPEEIVSWIVATKDETRQVANRKNAQLMKAWAEELIKFKPDMRSIARSVVQASQKIVSVLEESERRQQHSRNQELAARYSSENTANNTSDEAQTESEPTTQGWISTAWNTLFPKSPVPATSSRQQIGHRQQFGHGPQNGYGQHSHHQVPSPWYQHHQRAASSSGAYIYPMYSASPSSRRQQEGLYQQMNQRQQEQRPGMPIRSPRPEQRPSTPVRSPSTPQSPYRSKLCTICQEYCTSSGNCQKMGRCDHVFHKECIERHLQQGNTSCPNCREQVGTRVTYRTRLVPLATSI